MHSSCTAATCSVTLPRNRVCGTCGGKRGAWRLLSCCHGAPAMPRDLSCCLGEPTMPIDTDTHPPAGQLYPPLRDCATAGVGVRGRCGRAGPVQGGRERRCRTQTWQWRLGRGQRERRCGANGSGAPAWRKRAWRCMEASRGGLLRRWRMRGCCLPGNSLSISRFGSSLASPL